VVKGLAKKLLANFERRPIIDKIIPNVFREDYLLALRKLSRQGEPDIFIKAMQRVHNFSSMINGEDFNVMREFLNSTNAFSDSTDVNGRSSDGERQ